MTVPFNAALIEAFSGMFLSPRFDDARPTAAFHRKAWELYCSDHPRCLVVAPRDHAKSTALTFVYIMAEVLFRRSDYCILIGSTEEMAQEQLSNIADELHENDDLKREFGVAGFVTDSKTDIIVKFTDGVLFRILARGAEQRIRGRMWNGTRPNLIVCHAKGTQIYDHALGFWLKVEEHPTAKEIETDCVRLRIAFSEDDEYDEVVSTEHFYLVRKSLLDIPVWMQAKDIKLGYLIGDCDGQEINRLLPRNAGTNMRAISEEEVVRVQCNLPDTPQRASLCATKEVGRSPQGQGSPSSSRVGATQPSCGPTSEIRALLEEQRALRRASKGILHNQQGMETRDRSKAASFVEISDSEVVRQESYQENICASDFTRQDSGSHSSVGLQLGLRSSLRSEFTDNLTCGEQSQRESSLAGYAGFVWRPVIFKGDAGKGIVVMIKTKSGFYKSKFGMSHNCDDM